MTHTDVKSSFRWGWWQGALCLAAVLLGLQALTSCGGSSAGPPPVDLAGGGATTALAEALPLPSQIGRDPSALQTQLRCDGAGFRLDKPQQNVLAEGTAAVFSPAPVSGGGMTLPESAYAIYSFDLSSLSSLDTPLRIELQAPGASADGGTRMFVALSRPDRDTWQWGELAPDAPNSTAWSWGMSQSGGRMSGGMGRMNPVLPVVVLVCGPLAVHVQSVEVRPDLPPLAAGAVSYRKGWDGVIYGRATFTDSLRVVGDGTGQIFSSFYDSSNGQLYLARLKDRLWTTQAVDAEGDAGLFNDLVFSPGGGLFLPYTVALDHSGVSSTQGFIRTLQPDMLASLVWSPRSNFESGVDEMGSPIEAGAHVRCVFDAEGQPHLFYEDATTGRIRHAWRPLGMMDWLHEYVSPEGVAAGRPAPVRCPSGVCVVYMAEGQLFAAQHGTDGWAQYLLADDVSNPLDETAPLGFCDAAVRTTDNMLVVAYSAKGGGGGAGKVVFHDLSFTSPPSSVVFDDTPGTGAYIDLAMLGDGSVRIAQFNPKEYKVYFETGDIPSQEFTSLPAVQFMPDEDCDGISFWVSPDEDGDAGHDCALFTLSSRLAVDGVTMKKEFKGHVSLLK